MLFVREACFMHSPASLAASVISGTLLRRFFVTRSKVYEADVSLLASMLQLSQDSDNVVLTDLPEPYSTEAACIALISDSSGFTRTRFVAIAGCPTKANRLKLYCSEQFICANIIEDLSAFAQAERIMTSHPSAAASAHQRALFIPRTGSPHRAAVGPLRDIVDRLAPHSFPIDFSFKRHLSGSNCKPEAALHSAYQRSSGLCFSDDVLAFTHYNSVILRHSVSSTHLDVVIGTGERGFKDGKGDKAFFSSPSGIHFDASHGGWLIADTLNHCVRCINPDTLDVSTVSPSLFSRVVRSDSVPSGVVPPVQLSHHPFKQRVFLALRWVVSRLNLPIALTHVLEWIMTGMHFGRGNSGWRLNMSLSFEQFSQMSRIFRSGFRNSMSNVPMWRPHRVYSDGGGGLVVVSQGRFVAAIVCCPCFHHPQFACDISPDFRAVSFSGI
jgi:hypothetical protein